MIASTVLSGAALAARGPHGHFAMTRTAALVLALAMLAGCSTTSPDVISRQDAK